jgi:predicted NUDIX family phosphoesterase
VSTVKEESSSQQSVAEERVLVVPTTLFHSLGHFQGFTDDVDRYLPGLLEGEQVSYRPRSEMEQDPSFKQLIPYMLFCHHQPDGSVHLFQYTRGAGQGESRLHAKRSVGIGGHVSTLDTGPGYATTGAETGHQGAETGHQGAETGHQNVYREGMQRELAEEVVIETQYTEQCVGLINDDETPVGKVHLGVVHRFDVQSPAIRANESEIQNAGFRPIEEIIADLNQFETWSQIVIRALFS